MKSFGNMGGKLSPRGKSAYDVWKKVYGGSKEVNYKLNVELTIVPTEE